MFEQSKLVLHWFSRGMNLKILFKVKYCRTLIGNFRTRKYKQNLRNICVMHRALFGSCSLFKNSKWLALIPHAHAFTSNVNYDKLITRGTQICNIRAEWYFTGKKYGTSCPLLPNFLLVTIRDKLATMLCVPVPCSNTDLMKTMRQKGMYLNNGNTVMINIWKLRS